MRDEKKNVRKKWLGEIVPRISRGHFFLVVRVTHDGLRERGTTRRLQKLNQNYVVLSRLWMYFFLYSDHLIVDGSKLHLRDVNLTNDGLYQCAAENKYGMLVSATWVHVKGTGTCYVVKFILKDNHVLV